MALLRQINTQMLNGTLGEVAKACQLIFWIRSLDYHQQIYVSPNYEEFFQRSCDSLHRDPPGWFNTLVASDRDKLNNKFKQRADSSRNTEKPHLLSQNSLYFRVNKLNGGLSYFRDKAFVLLDSNEQPVAMAGIGQALKCEQWVTEKQDSLISVTEDAIEKAFIMLIQQVLKLVPVRKLPEKKKDKTSYTLMHEGHDLTFTPRQAQCLYYSAQGYSAKQIGYYLKISPRTVEIYLSQLKRKIGCRTKLQLLSKIDSQLMTSWHDIKQLHEYYNNAKP